MEMVGEWDENELKKRWNFRITTLMIDRIKITVFVARSCILAESYARIADSYMTRDRRQYSRMFFHKSL
ncbi:hypothetical protein FACS189472_11580 [Alphaproteobacteria bacterium]|nr:hypothetical protein FACS189472_11580 [Alphaproteobacteria bacterium]